MDFFALGSVWAEGGGDYAGAVGGCEDSAGGDVRGVAGDGGHFDDGWWGLGVRKWGGFALVARPVVVLWYVFSLMCCAGNWVALMPVFLWRWRRENKDGF